jgi:cytochrome c biogenesis protein CcmG/thiol:disulfide interchange protein DsbE
MRLRAVLLCLAACGGGALPPSAQSPLLEKPMPTIQRRAIDGRSVDTAGRGPIVVKFFAKYCEPCKKTLPAAERLSHEHPNVAFLGVALDEYEADVQEMVKSYGLTFPIIHDRANALAGRFRVDELPRTFVVDKAGTVRWVGGSKQTESDLEAAVEWAAR